MFMERFRSALLEGDFDGAVAAYGSGNINLINPYVIYQDSYYPIHACAQGGNIALMKWLIEARYVSFYFLKNRVQYTINTASGRTALEVATLYKRLEIIRYLIVEKGADIKGIKSAVDLQGVMDLLIRNLPVSSDGRLAMNISSGLGIGGFASPANTNFHHQPGQNNNTNSQNFMGPPATSGLPRQQVLLSSASMGQPLASSASTMSNSSTITPGATAQGMYDDDDDNECVICCDNQIDCVLTPCGHQVCCKLCGDAIKECPICRGPCSTMKIFKS